MKMHPLDRIADLRSHYRKMAGCIRPTEEYPFIVVSFEENKEYTISYCKEFEFRKMMEELGKKNVPSIAFNAISAQEIMRSDLIEAHKEREMSKLEHSFAPFE